MSCVSRQKIFSLELGRGIAALIVVLHHSGLSSDAFTTSDYGHIFGFGIYGVDFFFVLSGFIIYNAHRNDERTFITARAYLFKRLRRIYIPYIPISIALISAYTLFPSLSQGDREWGVFTSILLLPSSSSPALSVAWTLVFEIQFYIVFLIFFITRRFWWFIFFWFFVTAGMAFDHGDKTFETPFLSTFFDPLIMEFVAGMVAAVLYSRLKPSAWVGPTAIGIAGICFYVWYGTADRVFLGIALAPLVLGVALYEARFDLKIPNPLLLLGAASYSIYLIHNPLNSIVSRVFVFADYWILTFILCSFTGIICGIVYHLFFEKPVLKFIAMRDISLTELIKRVP